MEHPLAMDIEAMRRAGYATVDALVTRLADPAADPVLRRADAEHMRSRLGGPPPEQPAGYSTVLARVIADVLLYAARTDHPGYFAFIPNFTTWPAALAELTAAAANPYCGAWMESAGPPSWSWRSSTGSAPGSVFRPAPPACWSAAARPPTSRRCWWPARPPEDLPQAPCCTCRTRLTRPWPGPHGRWGWPRSRCGCCQPMTAGVCYLAPWLRRSGPTAAPAWSRSPCAPAPDRPTPARSIRSRTSPTSAPANGCGCTSTRPTAGSPRSPRRDGRCWPGSTAPTR